LGGELKLFAAEASSLGFWLKSHYQPLVIALFRCGGFGTFQGVFFSSKAHFPTHV